MAHLPRAPRGALAVALAGALALPLAVTVAPASADVDAPPAFSPVTSDAEQALAEAQQVLTGGAEAPADATLALRELALALPQLDRADRRAARALLARPNGTKIGSDQGAVWEGPEDPQSVADEGCSASVPVCVHWTNHPDDAPPPGDTDGDDIPNQVEKTVAVMENVWAVEIDEMGYRPPLTDERASEPDNDGVNFDVYLSDIGDIGLYGYCAVDDSRTRKGSTYRFYDVAAYCVLDEDYATNEFGSRNTPAENLKVTAAHEFFHAIQYAYDATEDLWLAEGSAAWIEDEVYDGVNDNRQYLAASQFSRPWQSLDSAKGLSRYGSWGFWRYLTERFGPGLMKSVWKRADASPVGKDDYSLTALEHVLRQRGADLTSVLGDFGLVLAEPREFLSEGEAFPSAVTDTFRLTDTRQTTKRRGYTLDHLSYAPVRFVPGDDLGSGARLQISVDLPARRTSPVARVLVLRDDGSTSGIRRIALNRKGDGVLRVGFAPDEVRHVVLSIGNASDAFRKCYSGTTQYSCYGGVPRDQNLRSAITASVLRGQ